MSIKIGTHRPGAATSTPDGAPAKDGSGPSTVVRELRRNAHTATQSLIDFGRQTHLMTQLTAAATGAGPAWQDLREEVMSHLPSDPGSLQLSFKEPFKQAEASAPGSPAYISALKQLKTAFTLARVLERLS